MAVPCQILRVTQCTPTWICEIPLTGYEIDNCGNRRIKIDGTCGVLRGKHLRMNAYCNTGITQYKWTLNSEILSQQTDEVTIDTTSFPEGDNIISLKVLNICGWSDIVQKTIKIIEPAGCLDSGCDFTITQP